MASPSQTGSPTPADVLRWVAESAPHLWFPGRWAVTAGVPRDALDDPLWALRQAGLVQVGDWVDGVGQGFQLTPEGERATRTPDPVRPPSPPPPRADEPTDDPLYAPHSEYAAGEGARRSLLDPRPAVITPFLLVVNVGWYLYGGVIALGAWAVSDYLRGTNAPVISPILLRLGAVGGPQLLAGEWWRLLTSCFVHVGLFHLLGNMITLALLGTVAEGVWGRWRFAVIYLLAGVAGSVTAMAVNPQTSGDQVVLVAGASGGLWGLLTAVTAWLLKNLKHLPADTGSEWGRKLAVVAAMNVVVSLAPGVSLAAHVGGAVAGVLIALCLARIHGDRRETAAAAAGLGLVCAAFAALLAVAMLRSDDWRDLREQHERKADRHLHPPPADASGGRP
ncbi:MAG: rhomboid family intramembrane serine protease [Gemmataceae bacterium]